MQNPTTEKQKKSRKTKQVDTTIHCNHTNTNTQTKSMYLAL